MSRARCYSTGFTLMELLVVLSIVEIVAALLFPVYGAARARPRQATCLSNYRQLGMAVTMYVQDYDERYMPSTNSLKQNSLPQWPRALALYTSGPLLNLMCSEVRRGQPAYSPDTPWNQPGWVAGYPATGYLAALHFTAGLNYLAFSPVWWDCPQHRGEYPDDTSRPAAVADIEQPANTVMFADSGLDHNTSGFYLIDPPNARAGSGCYYWFGGWASERGGDGGRSGPYGQVAIRHPGGVMVLWGDGHVKVERIDTLRNPWLWARRKS